MTYQINFGFALEYVSDIEAARNFYVDVLGMEVEREHPVFVQFRDGEGHAYAIASDETMSGDTKLELYWVVDDIDAALEAISAHTEVNIPLSEQPFGRVFGVRDPAGQQRLVLEFAKQRPSTAAS